MRNCIILLKATQTLWGPWRPALELFPSANLEQAWHRGQSHTAGGKAGGGRACRALKLHWLHCRPRPGSRRTILLTRQRSGLVISCIRRIHYLIDANYSPASIWVPAGFTDSHHGSHETPKSEHDTHKPHLFLLVTIYTRGLFVAGCKGLMHEK